MSTRPTVTVAIPTRDRPEYLHRSLTSVLSGTTVPDRVVVIDNSQRDPSRTSRICSEFSQVEYAAPVGNLSAAGNHNRAIDSASTDYVCVLHDDDIYGPEFLTRGVAALEADRSANLFAVHYGVIDGDDEVVSQKSWPTWQAGTFEPAQFLQYVLSTNCPVHFSAAMMRAGPARECRVADVDGNCFDMGYFFELGGRGRVILCDEPLMYVRIHQTMESVSAGFVQQIGRKRRSEALAFVPLEWGAKRRFFNSPTARVLGDDLKRVRVSAARQAISQLAPHLRGYPIAERVRIMRAIIGLLPSAVGSPVSTG